RRGGGPVVAPFPPRGMERQRPHLRSRGRLGWRAGPAFESRGSREGIMSIPLVQVDAFTDAPFAGNPAAVCLLDGPAEATWMQRGARDMDLSETAVLRSEGAAYRLRWFTPTVEIALCGHATVASAHVLWETGRAPRGGRIDFLTKSGLLSAEQRGAWIELDFP